MEQINVAVGFKAGNGKRMHRAHAIKVGTFAVRMCDDLAQWALRHAARKGWLTVYKSYRPEVVSIVLPNGDLHVTKYEV